jgi:hypothetical protein
MNLTAGITDLSSQAVHFDESQITDILIKLYIWMNPCAEYFNESELKIANSVSGLQMNATLTSRNSFFSQA